MNASRGPAARSLSNNPLITCLSVLLLVVTAGRLEAQWTFPPGPPPDEYGNIQINRTTERTALFSHWTHRQKFTCRVCHFELEFSMFANTTGITEAANQAGRYCGSPGCHDGKAAFGHAEGNCTRCHTTDTGEYRKKFSALSKFPKAKYGNNIDWVQALDKGLIKPVQYLSIKPADVAVIKPLLLEAEWSGIPPAVFSHKKHSQWLDCNNCHPDIFNIKKKTTKHFAMDRILKREFCGVCHLTVAFPMNDCKRCHADRGSVKE